MTVRSDQLVLRVMVTDVWEMVDVTATADTTVRELKRDVLRRALRREVRDGDYDVKHVGALVLDEQQTLGEIGVNSGAPLIVLPTRRRPVR